MSVHVLGNPRRLVPGTKSQDGAEIQGLTRNEHHAGNFLARIIVRHISSYKERNDNSNGKEKKREKKKTTKKKEKKKKEKKTEKKKEK
ncbi:uncharacterized protein UV8b_00916 [Ustilaginoidea virens]|uniref:Uncharacterized protein n=1 Tax=Ustilaginoidea virens TaxID=1159556 RepID=A0A8E5HJN2_USTVR|nr:uncharacterized protein UV8b_00916 [Ustilaginoidea virens]QUC16675.1 hypothetical protein UV8b_00916 [Ustilaginoidea virens]